MSGDRETNIILGNFRLKYLVDKFKEGFKNTRNLDIMLNANPYSDAISMHLSLFVRQLGFYDEPRIIDGQLHLVQRDTINLFTVSVPEKAFESEWNKLLEFLHTQLRKYLEENNISIDLVYPDK